MVATSDFIKSFAIATLLSLLLICGVGWGAVDFDGTDGYVEITDDASLDLSTGFTISAWVNADSYTASPGGAVFNKWYDGSKRAYYVNIETDGEVQVGVAKSDGQSQIEGNTSGVNMVVNTWYHIAVKWDTTLGEAKVYKNGTYVESVGSGDTDTINTDNNMDPKIGQDYSTRYFNGTISDVAVWSVAITDDEIALLAQSRMKRMPLQIQPSNLKAYLPLDDVSEGTTINTKDFIDMSGNGNNGTGSDAGGESIGEAETYISYPPD